MVLVVVIEVMHAVRVVPEDPEILGRGAQSRESAHGLVGVGIALRVGVLRNTPDAFDRLVFGDKLFHKIHVRACLRHRHRDVLDPEVLRDREVPVIARRRAEELHLIQLRPGRAAHDAVRHRAGHGVVHDVQGRVAVDDDVVGVVLHHVAEQDLRRMDAVEDAVVAAVRSVLAGQVRLGIEGVHQSHGQVQLFAARLAAGHVEIQVHRLEAVVLRLQLRELLLQFLFRHFLIRFHLYFPHCFLNIISVSGSPRATPAGNGSFRCRPAGPGEFPRPRRGRLPAS